MASEQMSVPGESFRDLARLVLQNWRQELRLYFGERLPSLTRVPDTLVLALTGETFSLASSDGDQLGRYPSDAEGIESAILHLAQSGHLVRGRADVSLRFGSESVLRPELRLPKASSTTLRGALSFELERLSPVAPSELYFDHVVTSYDRPTNRLSLTVRALKRCDVDAALNLCRSMGLSVSSMTIEGDPLVVDARYFPVDRLALLRSLWRSFGALVLGALAVFLLIAVIAAGANRVSESNEALSSAVALESVRATQVERLLHKMDLVRSQTAYVVDKRRAPLFVEALANLTDALPDGTWVDQVSINGTKLHVQGYSQTASDLIPHLDRSGHFANAQFGAPLVRNATDGTERFDLSADVLRKP